MRRDHARGVEQPSRAFGERDALLVEEHDSVERAESTCERMCGACLTVRCPLLEGAGGEHEDKPHTRITLGCLHGACHRRDGIEPVPDAAVPEHDLGVVDDVAEMSSRPCP